MKKIISLLVITTKCFINLALANQSLLMNSFLMSQGWNFVENKGQLSDLNGKVDTDVKYYGNDGGCNIFCRPGKISFVFQKNKKKKVRVSEANGQFAEFATDLSMTTREYYDTKTKFSKLANVATNRIDLVLLNSNNNAEIFGCDQQSYYENFYLAHISDDGLTKVNTFKTVTYKNIYPNIDMVLHCSEKGMKYEFVIYPHGKVSDIKIKWNGFESIHTLKYGGICYAFPLGKIEEGRPYTFQGKREIQSKFISKCNLIEFKIGNYNKNKKITIDPILSWGSYFGGNGLETGSGICCDKSGNIFITGSTSSLKGISSVGAFQSNVGGDGDAFVSKFSPSGQCIWSTYYGGNYNDGGTSIIIDGSNNVVIVGQTYSTNAIATSGAYQTKFSGDSSRQDVFIAKFSSSGFRIWSTYFGGDGTQGAYGIATDNFGNLFITGLTTSTINISSLNAYQKNYGGNSDAFIAKFSTTGGCIWSTYFGGNGIDEGHSICIDNVGNICIGGYTRSAIGIASSGSYQSSFGGGTSDGFLAKFNSGGNRIWSTYFGGKGPDGITGVAVNNNNDIIFAGSTSSSNGISSNGAYQTSYGGGLNSDGNGDAFIGKFTSNCNLLWSTYFGGSGEEKSTSIITDSIENIFFTGPTNSKSGIATSGAYKTSISGGATFLAEFSKSGNLAWSTYYGNGGGANGIAVDNHENVYILGTTSSTTGMSTSGAYQTTYGGGIDAFIAKFSFKTDNDAGIANIVSPITNLCPGTQPVTIKLRNYGLQELDKVSIGWSINHITQTPYSWTAKLATDSAVSVSLGSYAFTPGTDTLRAWTSLPNGQTDSMPGNDTARVLDTVWAAPNAHFSVSYAGQATYLHATDSSMADTTYHWSLGDANTGISHLVKHIYTHNAIYNISLKITNAAGCKAEFDSAVNITSSGIIAQLVLDNLGFNIYPNPFYTITKLEYNLIKTTDISISIFDAGGKEINIMPTQMQSPGKYEIAINAEKYHLEPGTYVVRMMVGDGEVKKKMVVGK